ncbi:Pfp [Desulforapulum autotrophicum HRM2]|uniref:Pfp n=1 Tax=Desulforapulum autotrophicum (strain ATCC 43914 / DSM 3382 / VKM B-1955 / HRM2) TaxID=177437 RepID=C0QJ77_DESAH|nr:6-phosphofructokinase [Desulforapulum autotrophicum]ACN15890.1 Pfp [Desulforapulum autotrophicum HRM2]
MEHSSRIDIKTLLNHAKTASVIADINREAIERRAFAPKKCQVFSEGFTVLEDQPQYRFSQDREAEKVLADIIDNHVQKIVPGTPEHSTEQERYFKRRNIGIVFSGGPAPGGHNVISGIFDAAKKANPASRVYGFILGPAGILERSYVEITESLVDAYRNMGGFNMIKTGRTKIDLKKKMDLSRATCKALELDALVIVGGDDSNTNAAFLAQELKVDGIQVIGVPKTIDGDIRVSTEDGDVLCSTSFGFHTAARAFAQNISNLCTDASSDIKYWHVCKVMGRVASHLALETALQTHANLTLIGEDLADYVDQERLKAAQERGEIDYTAYGMTLRHLSRLICETIVKRAASGKNYGVMIIPEGVLEFINEIQIFIIKLSTIIAEFNNVHDLDFHASFPNLDARLDYLRRLSRGISDRAASPIWNLRDDELFNDLPAFFQEGLLVERDTHGNFQFSQVKTEKILMDMAMDYLEILREKGIYKVGINRRSYESLMAMDGLDAEGFGRAIFKNYDQDGYLLVKETIISLKTLTQTVMNAGLIDDEKDLPGSVVDLFKKSVPKFSIQTHFYGYDGRGSDPTKFDCNYTYNLGLTAFSLIANGATGQMAVIKNLEHKFCKWEPLGIPISSLMHLEERKGKLALVIEKSIVDVESNAFRVVKALREKWLAAEPGDDCYRRPGPVRFTGSSEEDRPITLMLNSIH